MKKLITIALLISLSGCTNRIVDFTIISSKNIDLSKGASFTRGKNRASGTDMTMMILDIPIGTPNLKTALDKAIESTKGCVALVDGVVYYKYWNAVLYGQSKYVVEGTPLIDPSLVAMNGTSSSLPHYAEVKLDKNYNIVATRQLTKEEYIAMKEKIVKRANGEKTVSVKEENQIN